MKLPPFNHAEMEWDGWRAFHVDHGHNKFTQFDTGEFVVCRNRWNPDSRQVFKDLHIQVTGTGDKDCPRLYIPGSDKPIPKSHLDYKGMQILLLDFDHKRAVSLDIWLDKNNSPQVPHRFTGKNTRDITAWYAGPKAVPIGTPIRQYHPFPLTHGQRTHLEEIKNACDVWLQMQSNPDGLKKQHHNVSTKVGEFVDVSFSVLTEAHRTAIAAKGFYMIVTTDHPWLTFNVEGEWTNDEADDD